MTPDTLSRQAKLEAIRRKCVEANPHILTVDYVVGEPKEGGRREHFRDLRLADVLLALHGKAEMTTWTVSMNDGSVCLCLNTDSNEKAHWNLRRDSLDDQDDATIDSLHSLLCK